MNIYALINDGVVVNTIVAEADFLPLISADYDAVVEIDNLGDVRPGVYWLWDGVTFIYGAPPSDPP